MTEPTNFRDVVTFANGFIIPPQTRIHTDTNKNEIVLGLQVELISRGYMLSKNLYDDLLQADRNYLKNLYKVILTYIDETIGNGHFKPLFEGFPQSVMNMSEYDFYLNQVLHYFSNGKFIPDNTIYEPSHIKYMRKSYTIIEKGTEEMFLGIFTTLCSAPVALTPQDTAIFDFFVKYYSNKLILPAAIPMKEIVCKLIDAGLYVPKTVTDVLRYAGYISYEDASLPTLPPKMIKESSWSNYFKENPERSKYNFKKFSRAERKKILGLLEMTNMDISEMKLKKGSWIRLGEILHPGQYAKQFPYAFDMFNRLRNEKIQSWYGKAEAAKNMNLSIYIKVLKERPGEFARRLDYCLRTYANKSTFILVEFMDIADKISNKVLFELYAHFLKRTAEYNRSVFIKGARSATPLPTLDPLPKKLVDTVLSTIIEAIKRNIGNKESFNKQMIYISDDLKNMPAPLSMRSVSEGLKQLPRGTKIPFEMDKKILRFYTHWTDENCNEDLDLSAFMIDSDNKSTIVGWNGTYSVNQLAIFSGDVRHREGDCAEYIDVDVEQAISKGFKYCVIDVNNYEGRSFSSVKAFAGWMTLDIANADDTWLPSEVSQSFAINSPSSNICCAIIDFTEKQIIIVDEDYNGIPVSSANRNNKIAAIDKYTKNSYLSIHDIIKWNIDARDGVLVTDDMFKNLSETAKAELIEKSIVYDFKYFFDDYKRVFELL